MKIKIGTILKVPESCLDSMLSSFIGKRAKVVKLFYDYGWNRMNLEPIGNWEIHNETHHDFLFHDWIVEDNPWVIDSDAAMLETLNEVLEE